MNIVGAPLIGGIRVAAAIAILCKLDTGGANVN